MGRGTPAELPSLSCGRPGSCCGARCKPGARTAAGARARARAGAHVCRSDGSAAPGKRSCRARSRSFPPTRQGVPASRLPAGEGRGGGKTRRGPLGLASLVPGFLSAFPEQDRPGDGTGRSAPSPGAQPGNRVLGKSGSSSSPECADDPPSFLSSSQRLQWDPVKKLREEACRFQVPQPKRIPIL